MKFLLLSIFIGLPDHASYITPIRVFSDVEACEVMGRGYVRKDNTYACVVVIDGRPPLPLWEK